MKSVKVMIILVITLLALAIEITGRRTKRTHKNSKKWRHLDKFDKWGPGKKEPFMRRVPDICASCRNWCVKFSSAYYGLGADTFYCACLSSWGVSKEGEEWKVPTSEEAAAVNSLVDGDNGLKLPC